MLTLDFVEIVFDFCILGHLPGLVLIMDLCTDFGSIVCDDTDSTRDNCMTTSRRLKKLNKDNQS